MCMSINFNEPIKIVTESITCYKVLTIKKRLFSKRYYAPIYSDFSYELNKLYNTKIRRTEYCVFEGFHSFLNKEDAIEYSSEISNPVIIKAIVPKDSKYITGITFKCSDVMGPRFYDSVVSDRIKILEIIK